MNKLILSLFILIIFSCNNNDKRIIENNKLLNDSVLIKNLKNNVIKTIFFPSKRKDSFDYVEKYKNDSLMNSGFISKGGFRRGYWTEFYKDHKTISEYIILNNKEYLNQLIMVKDRDTLNKGNFYRIKYFGEKKIDKEFQFQLTLTKPYLSSDSSKVYMLIPRGKFTDLKSDFSNLNKIELDTLYNLSEDNLDNEYNNKRFSDLTVALDLVYKKSGEKYIRGVLIETIESKIDSIEEKMRFIYINESINIGNVPNETFTEKRKLTH